MHVRVIIPVKWEDPKRQKLFQFLDSKGYTWYTTNKNLLTYMSYGFTEMNYICIWPSIHKITYSKSSYWNLDNYRGFRDDSYNYFLPKYTLEELEYTLDRVKNIDHIEPLLDHIETLKALKQL